MSLQNFSRYLSTYFALVPIIAFIIVIRKAEPVHRYFFCYLMLGFLVDSFNPFYTKETGKYIYNGWCIFEIFFLLWFLRQIALQPWLKKSLSIALILIIPFWISCIILISYLHLRYSTLFDITSAILISSFATILLLQMTQRVRDIAHQTNFWLLNGVFFYFFCANFLFGLTNTDIKDKIWFIHSIISVITNLFFLKGFLVLKSITGQKRVMSVER